MAREGVAVEINLTSNAVILGVKGAEHPFALYRRHGVPVVLATDDEGVLRTDLTHEYQRAVQRAWPRLCRSQGVSRASSNMLCTGRQPVERASCRPGPLLARRRADDAGVPDIAGRSEKARLQRSGTALCAVREDALAACEFKKNIITMQCPGRGVKAQKQQRTVRSARRNLTMGVTVNEDNASTGRAAPINRGTRRACGLRCWPARRWRVRPGRRCRSSPGAETDGEKEIVVTGSLGALPLKDVGSVFGFDKTLAETPRSASTVSSEQLERFGITQIYDLVSQVPGTFTSSFFGTGGALDIRGTPAKSISVACCVWKIPATIPPRLPLPTASTSCAARPRRSMARRRPAAT
jgi:hypothetical protein